MKRAVRGWRGVTASARATRESAYGRLTGARATSGKGSGGYVASVVMSFVGAADEQHAREPATSYDGQLKHSS
jgi:hypothetical protein